MKKPFIYIGVILLVAIALTVGLSFLNNSQSNEKGEYDSLAQCISDKGAIFYGAFWCPHCAEQKKLFGPSVKLLPYRECSTPDGTGQTEECKAQGIQGYPTWKFADGSVVAHGMTIAELAAKTGCAITSTSTDTLNEATSSAK